MCHSLCIHLSIKCQTTDQKIDQKKDQKIYQKIDQNCKTSWNITTTFDFRRKYRSKYKKSHSLENNFILKISKDSFLLIFILENPHDITSVTFLAPAVISRLYKLGFQYDLRSIYGPLTMYKRYSMLFWAMRTVILN